MATAATSPGGASSDVPTGSSTTAQVRAGWCKYSVRRMKIADPHVSKLLLQGLGESLRAEIRAPGPLEWVDFRLFLQMCEAIRRAVGPEGAREYWREALGASVNQPLMRPLARGALMVWGRNPGSLYRRTPQAWQLVTRHCGTMRTEEAGERDTLLMHVQGLPAFCRGKLGLLHMWEGGFIGQGDSVDHEVRVDTRVQDFASRGEVTFHIRWWPRHG